MIESEKQLIEYCKKLIEQKLNWGKSEEWRNKEFIDLSDTLYNETELRISTSTLKRLWGRIKYDGSPNHYTLDALAAFLGYNDWKDFKTSNYHKIAPPIAQDEIHLPTNGFQHPASQEESAEQISFQPTTAPQAETNSNHDSFKLSKPYLFLIGFLILIIGIGLGMLILKFIMPQKESVNFLVNPPKTVLFAYPTIAKEYPAKVKFMYDISAVQEATPKGWHLTNILSFGHDTRAKLIYSGDEKGETEYIYPVPGIYQPKIFTNIKQTSETLVLVKSKGWLLNLDMQDTSIMLDKLDTIFQKYNMMLLKEQDIKQIFPKYNSPHTKIRWCSYSKFDNFNINGDNLTFKADIQRPYNEPDGLNTVDIRIRGRKNTIHIQFIGKGHSDKIYLGFSEKKGIHHENPDVYKAFEQDFSEFRSLKIETKVKSYFSERKKTVTVYLDNTSLYQTTYEEPIGEILGISFHFRNTLGIIKNIELSDDVVYYNYYSSL
ncbi:MAG: hypothetical protein NZM38_11215 [Cytophagales bacterium]|nr:hypothetical protein [Cytophagales bacterium]MDW8385325.1 hypothetical protein [Flammeovirgaceae bacterium]